MEALNIQQLRKTYSAGVEALKGVDLKVKQGEFFALLGPNGAGKSTLIGILTGLVNKTSGKVRVFDEDLDVAPSRLKAQLGVMTQELNFNIFESCWNTVNFQAGYYGIDWKEAGRRTEQLLRDLELWDKAHQPVRNLSGGMKRRLMLARALVHDPKLLILDEPTAGLDIELRRSLWVYLQKRNEAGLTIILTTHYLEEADAFAERIVVIANGRVVADGSASDIRARGAGRILSVDIPEANERAWFAQATSTAGMTLIETRGRRAYFSAPDTDAAALALLTALGSKNLEIAAPTLDSAFVALTGEQPEAEEAAPHGRTRGREKPSAPTDTATGEVTR